MRTLIKIFTLCFVALTVGSGFFVYGQTVIEKWSKFETKEEVKNANRHVKSQATLDATKNKSQHNLASKSLAKLENTFGRNFSFCDFNNTNIEGKVFERCNFSFARNLDEAITDAKTKFIECNFTGVPRLEMPSDKIMENCNTNKALEDFTDEEIKEMFKNDEEITNITHR